MSEPMMVDRDRLHGFTPNRRRTGSGGRPAWRANRDHERLEALVRGWSVELSSLRAAAAQVEAEARAEFNLLLAATAPSHAAVWGQLYAPDLGSADQVEAQLQAWKRHVRELQVAASRAEAEANAIYARLCPVVRTHPGAGPEQQPARAASATPGPASFPERASDIVALQAQAHQAAEAARDAYHALLLALHAGIGMARAQRRALFSGPHLTSRPTATAMAGS